MIKIKKNGSYAENISVATARNRQAGDGIKKGKTGLVFLSIIAEGKRRPANYAGRWIE